MRCVETPLHNYTLVLEFISMHWLHFLLFLPTFWAVETEYIEKLQNGLIETEKVLTKLSTRWNIQEFPNFLNSVAMPLSSWDILR